MNLIPNRFLRFRYLSARILLISPFVKPLLASSTAKVLWEYFTDVCARLLGTPKALVAAAHKLARIVYNMLKSRVPDQALPAEQVDRQYQQRLLHRLQKQAQQLGAQLLLPSDPQTA